MISYRRFREFLGVAFGPHVSIRNWWSILKAGLVLRGVVLPMRSGLEELRFVMRAPYLIKPEKPVSHIKNLA
jgi:hypothetical protein